jgi:sugar O-acyltransferase (sialic acid O-acetyltransferase NeuD family)
MRRDALLLFPCNGNAAEAIDCLSERYSLIGFVDDAVERQGESCHGYLIFGRDAFARWPEARVLAVPGGPRSYATRRALIESLGIGTSRFTRIVHASACISPLALLGQNLLIMAGVVVTSNARIGDHVCVLPNSVVHHDVSLGAWSLVGSNVTIAGGAAIEDNCYIGSGCNIMNGVRIGRGALVGLGANVVRDVRAGARVAGNPAREL